METPAELTGIAADEWERITHELEGSITPQDRGQLTLHCILWAQMDEALTHIREEGAVKVLSNGVEAASSWWKVYSEAAKLDRTILQSFGGSPAARAKLPEKPVEEQAEFDLA